MKNIQVDNNLLLDKKTGSLRIFEPSDELRYFAVLVKAGHCGNGYYNPLLLPIATTSQEMAIEIAKNLSRVKKRNDIILGVEEINQTQFLAVEYINDCDPYFHLTRAGATVRDMDERRIPMKGLINWQKREITTPEKLDIEEVKTASEYDEKYVLQRYCAPLRYGKQFVYNRKIKMKNLIDDFIHQGTIEQGIKNKKLSILSMYYQLNGKNNRLGIGYKNGIITFKDAQGTEFELPLPQSMRDHIEASIKHEEEISSPEETITKPVILPSRRSKFASKYAKYQQIKNSNTSVK